MALYRLDDGVFATSDVCPHRAPLRTAAWWRASSSARALRPSTSAPASRRRVTTRPLRPTRPRSSTATFTSTCRRRGDRFMNAGYMSGFGNGFETEALPGALPIGRNSPQKCAYGLYAEQLERLALHRAARHQRALLALSHPPDRGALGPTSRKADIGLWRTAPCREVELPIAPMRWRPVPIPAEPLSFLEGVRTITTAGDAGTQAGMARARLPRHALDGGRVLLQRRRRDAVRAAAGRAAAVDRVRHHRHRARRDRRHPARREVRASSCRAARRAAISARTTAAPSRCPSAARSAPTAWPTRATS